MPSRVDTGGFTISELAVDVDLLGLAVVGDDGAAVRVAGMELHAPGVPLLEVMAVDALSASLRRAEHVVDDDLLVEAFQTALVDGQLLVGDVRGRNHAIAEVGVDAVGRHIYIIRCEAHPLAIFLCKDFHADAVATSRYRQRPPLVHVGAHLESTADELTVASLEPGYCIVGSDQEFEVQWSQIDGNGHADVVGIDERLLLQLLIVGRDL